VSGALAIALMKLDFLVLFYQEKRTKSKKYYAWTLQFYIRKSKVK